VGEELGLAPGCVRELAIGALVHDVGKLSAPDEILQKPTARGRSGTCWRPNYSTEGALPPGHRLG
jgi:hypothetical protein